MLSLLGIALVLPTIFRPQSPVDEAVQRPLIVNGRAIEAEEIRRQLIHAFGKATLDARLLRFTAEWGIRNGGCSGVDLAHLSEERLAADYADATRVPEDSKLSPQSRLRAKFGCTDCVREIVSARLAFDDVFLPNNPAEWPRVTREAVVADSGEVMIEDANLGYRLRVEAALSLGQPVQREEPIYRDVLRDIVFRAITRTWNIQTSANGLRPELLLRVDVDLDGSPELEISTEQTWRDVAPNLHPSQVEIVRRWLAASQAMRDRLRADGQHFVRTPITDHQAELAKAQSSGGMPDYERIARSNWRFPSLQAFCEYRDLRENFRALVERETAQSPESRWAKVLRAQEPRVQQMYGLGQVNAEFILVSAFDFPEHEWKPDGWESARSKAREISRKIGAAPLSPTSEHETERTIRKGEAPRLPFWSELIDRESEFWDPPPPTRGFACGIAYRMRGRFGEKYRNGLESILCESVFTQIANGSSLSDHVFFDQPVGAIEGPFRGPHGYYFARVLERRPATAPLLATNERHRELMQDGCVDLAFLEYARDALAHADIRGLEDR